MTASEHDFTAGLRALLEEGVQEGVFPGAVAAVGQLCADQVVRSQAAAGRLEVAGEDVVEDTVYDLASLTKPVIATVALRLCQAQGIDLHEPVTRWLPELAGTRGGEASLALLLAHRAGLAPGGGLYKELNAPAGSAAAQAYLLREAGKRTTAEASPYPAVYSDLGYLVAGEALARAVGLSLAKLVVREVTEPLGVSAELFYPAALSSVERAQRLSRCAPSEFCAFRVCLVRGTVHDENCAVYGGVAGHAGLFGTARAVLQFGLAWLYALQGRSRWLDLALVHWALRPRPGGSYVLGWDTKSPVGSSAGSEFSELSFGHLGFTGTSLWCDPARGLCAVLLSNRIHPRRDNTKIREFRPRFHDFVACYGSVLTPRSRSASLL